MLWLFCMILTSSINKPLDILWSCRSLHWLWVIASGSRRISSSFIFSELLHECGTTFHSISLSPVSVPFSPTAKQLSCRFTAQIRSLFTYDLTNSLWPDARCHAAGFHLCQLWICWLSLSCFTPMILWCCSLVSRVIRIRKRDWAPCPPKITQPFGSKLVRPPWQRERFAKLAGLKRSAIETVTVYLAARPQGHAPCP